MAISRTSRAATSLANRLSVIAKSGTPKRKPRPRPSTLRRLGVPCGDVDAAARRCIEAHGFGPNYALPGLPHRTGHGIGLDIHEGPYLVASDRTPPRTGHVL